MKKNNMEVFYPTSKQKKKRTRNKLVGIYFIVVDFSNDLM